MLLPFIDFDARYEDFRTGEILIDYADINKPSAALDFNLGTAQADSLHKTW